MGPCFPRKHGNLCWTTFLDNPWTGRLAAKRPTRSCGLYGSLCRKRHSDKFRRGPNMAMVNPSFCSTIFPLKPPFIGDFPAGHVWMPEGMYTVFFFLLSILFKNYILLEDVGRYDCPHWYYSATSRKWWKWQWISSKNGRSFHKSDAVGFWSWAEHW